MGIKTLGVAAAVTAIYALFITYAMVVFGTVAGYHDLEWLNLGFWETAWSLSAVALVGGAFGSWNTIARVNR